LKTIFKQKKLHASLFFKYYSFHPKIQFRNPVDNFLLLQIMQG
jgi:hypothetical protein